MTLVFVYGTLRAGEVSHGLLAAATFAGPARTAPAFTLHDLGPYPALTQGGSTAVQGELYEVDAPTLARLDELEGHPGFYAREPIPLADGRTALAYLLPPSRARGAPTIASGDWPAYARSRREPPGGSSPPVAQA